MVILPIKRPELFNEIGVDPPKGILFYGPPGTGKTHFVRALANELDASYFSISSSELVIGSEGEQKLRKIFDEAKENLPSLIFIDEIDSIAPSRESTDTGVAEKRMVTTLLTLINGINKKDKIIIVGATNRRNAIDSALRRPGRFDREIEIPLPNLKGRKEILQLYIEKMKVDNDVDIDYLAKITNGYAAADIEHFCKEAGIQCIRRNIAPINDISSELNDIIIIMDDFIRAFGEIQPSTLREIEVEEDLKSWEETDLPEIKIQFEELIIRHLEHSDKLKELNIPNPEPIVIEGPSGSGKTWAIKALAKEGNLNLISINAIDIFLNKSIGSDKIIQNAFYKARQSAPAILLIENLDSIYLDDLTIISHQFTSRLIRELNKQKFYSNVFIIASVLDINNLPKILLGLDGFTQKIKIKPLEVESRKKIINRELNRLITNDFDVNDVAGMMDGLYAHEVVHICDKAKRRVINLVDLEHTNINDIKINQNIIIEILNNYKQK